MKPFFVRALPALALMTSVTGAFANPIIADGIESISLNLGKTAYEVRVHNASQSTALASLNLAVKTNTLNIPAQGSAKCSKGNPFLYSSIGIGVFNPTFLDANVIHSVDFPIAAMEWSNGQWIAEAMDPNFSYTAPVASLQNPGKPDLQIDALAEVAKLRDAYIQNGGTELGFYRATHEVVLERKVSAIVSCLDASYTAAGKATVWKPITVKVIYEGDPDLTNFALNAVLQGQGGLVNEVNQDLPMNVNSGKLLPYSPNFVGQCPVDLKFRVDITGSGNGSLKYRIVEGSGTVHQSETHDYAAENGVWKHDFVYPIEWEGPESLQKTERTFKLYVSYLDEDEFGVPTMYNLFDQVNWSHKCTPKLNVGIGGVNEGGLLINQGGEGNSPLGYGQGVGQSRQNAAPSAVFKPTPTKPARAATPTPAPARAATSRRETAPARATTTTRETVPTRPQPERAAPTPERPDPARSTGR